MVDVGGRACPRAPGRNARPLGGRGRLVAAGAIARRLRALVCVIWVTGCVGADPAWQDRPFPKLGQFPPVPQTKPAEEWDALEGALIRDRTRGSATDDPSEARPPPPAAEDDGAVRNRD